MPCFKGLAVSIHTPEGPISEYSIQKQSRQSRISAYIPVPPPKLSKETGELEQAHFSISITLLQPGQGVPYSAPAWSSDQPFPQPKIVGGLPEPWGSRGSYSSVVTPYQPLTSSPNETVAAYIHFDGRTKEEVATLLRKGEETWVNSRWVSVPLGEGGGLAEKEFIFREVGLERWLNGLDLQGETHQVQAKIEKRKQRLERKRRKRMEARELNSENEEEEENTVKKGRSRPVEDTDVLRYGENKSAPLESLNVDENVFSSDSNSDDDVPPPEAAGQIKVSLFRVLASGEIKRGEYSPQFDVHDDEDGAQANGGSSADVDHTTSFAKAKTLDPKSISTQTVTGIDNPDTPYATFTFFYRGEKQLQKMGILASKKEAETSATVKRKSHQFDFSALGPLKTKGTVGFAGYRDSDVTSPTFNGSKKGKDSDDMDSDADDDDASGPHKRNGTSQDDTDAQEEEKADLSPEEISKRGELAEGVKKIQLKRQLSFESSARTNSSPAAPPALSPQSSAMSAITAALQGNTAPMEGSQPATLQSEPSQASSTDTKVPPPDISIGSPFKRQRSSLTADGLNVGPFPSTALSYDNPADNGSTIAKSDQGGMESSGASGIVWKDSFQTAGGSNETTTTPRPGEAGETETESGDGQEMEEEEL